MASNDSMHKTELAFKAVLETVAAAQSLVQRVGLDTSNKDKKSLTATAESAAPVYNTTANRNVTISVAVKTNMDDTTETQHKNLCEEVFDVLYDDGLAATLSAALSDFTCFHVEPIGEQPNQVDRSHETQARFLCHVAPSDIS